MIVNTATDDGQDLDVTTTATTCAILARDFSPLTTDVNRDTWTPGKLRYVIEALAGDPVVLTVDRQTGCTHFGVVLERVQSGFSHGYTVTVRFPGGQRTAFNTRNIGEAIIPMVDRLPRQDAKWEAKDNLRRDQSAAIRKAQAEHGEVEGRGWGRWSASVDCAVPGRHMDVRYEPSTGNPATAPLAGPRWYGTVQFERDER